MTINIRIRIIPFLFCLSLPNLPAAFAEAPQQSPASAANPVAMYDPTQSLADHHRMEQEAADHLASLEKIKEDKLRAFQANLLQVDQILRRVIKILTGNYGGPEKITESIRLLDALISIHRNSSMDTLQRAAAYKQLGVEASMVKTRLKAIRVSISSEDVQVLLKDQETQHLFIYPESLNFLKLSFSAIENHITSMGVEIGAGIGGYGHVGLGLGAEEDAVGRKHMAVCSTSGGGESHGGAFCLLATFQSCRPNEPAAGQSSGYNGVGGAAGIAGEISSSGVKVGVGFGCFLGLGAFETSNVVTVLSRFWYYGNNFETMRALLGITATS